MSVVCVGTCEARECLARSLAGVALKNVAQIVKPWKAQSRSTGVEDRQSQLKRPKADQNKQHNKK